MAQFFNSDCFNVFPTLEENSIDLVVVDVPYQQTCCAWDVAIDLDKMWIELKRICSRKCLYVFFTTTKYGVNLINSKPRWFKYDLVWSKSKKVGFLSCNKMPLRKHEMIYVFGDNQGGVKTYNPQKVEGKPYKLKQGNQKETYGIENSKKVITINNGDRHPDSILKIEPDHEMVYVFGDNQGGVKTYNPQKVKGKPYKSNGRASGGVYRTEKDGTYSFRNDMKIDNKGYRHPDSILKIRGGKYDDSPYGDFYNTKSINNDNMYHPSTILEFKNPNKPVHRTQKSVKLYEWLIKSYSNEGDTVLDFCAGSCTNAIACHNTKRKSINVEMDEEIFKIGKNRYDEHVKKYEVL